MNSILLLDNYDSFTYNLYNLIQKNYIGDVIVKRDIEIIDSELENYDAFIISPGPGNPLTTPKAMEIISKFAKKKPILGICLGMQCLNQYFCGKTIKAIKPVHGKTSIFSHNNRSKLFIGLPTHFEIARYHSLQIVPSENLVITGYSDDNTIMSIEHETLPIFGLQFHPESFLSQYGDEIIINFLQIVGFHE